MVDFAVVPKRTALVNVDMQNCFVEGSPLAAPEGLAILERINRLAVICRRSDILVIHTRSVFRSDGSNIGVLGEFDPAVRTGILNQGSPAAALHPRLVVEAGDIILDKPRFGAFHSTDLQLILRSRGIDTLMITGIATNVCCETTAREAAVLDFRVFFLNDGTATFPIGDLSASDLQRATCATLGLVFAQVLTVNDMIKKIERAAQTTAAQA
jgi:nicotinamidase-related amidase